MVARALLDIQNPPAVKVMQNLWCADLLLSGTIVPLLKCVRVAYADTP